MGTRTGSAVAELTELVVAPRAGPPALQDGQGVLRATRDRPDAGETTYQPGSGPFDAGAEFPLPS